MDLKKVIGKPTGIETAIAMAIMKGFLMVIRMEIQKERMMG